MSMRALIARMDQELVPKGFIRKKQTWNRERGVLVDVIDIQINKLGDKATLNVGLLSRHNYYLCWGRDVGTFVPEHLCTVRRRVGQLIDNFDIWWDLNDERVEDAVLDSVRRWIYPFFKHVSTLDEMRDLLIALAIPSPNEPEATVCYAALLAQLGDLDAAYSVLAEFEKKALGAWEAHVREVAHRIRSASV